MSICENNKWREDICEVIETLPELSFLKGRTVLVTGASGLICSALIDLLLLYNESNDVPIRIIASGRNISKIKMRFLPYLEYDYFEISLCDFTKDVKLSSPFCDYIIHGAGNAYPEAIVNEPVETMLGNFVGLNTLMAQARLAKIKRILYISSSEVYGKKESNVPYGENDYGFIDVLAPRNSYSIGKRAAETLCISYAEEYGVNTVIARPGHIYGPTASTKDNRVSSAWAYAAAQGKDIVMKSDGSQIRSYCYCLDCASAIIKILLSGEAKSAYNISNPSSVISIREMGKLMAEAGGVKLLLQIPTEEEKKLFNPMQNSSLDASRLEGLGWKPLFDAKRGIMRTVDILRDIMQL